MIGLIYISILSLFLNLIVLFIILKYTTRERLGLKLTSGRRALIWISIYLLILGFNAKIYNLISDNVFIEIIRFAMVSSGIGAISIGGEKIFNKKND